jgi:hypothetical protein
MWRTSSVSTMVPARTRQTEGHDCNDGQSQCGRNAQPQQCLAIRSITWVARAARYGKTKTRNPCSRADLEHRQRPNEAVRDTWITGYKPRTAEGAAV